MYRQMLLSSTAVFDKDSGAGTGTGTDTSTQQQPDADALHDADMENRLNRMVEEGDDGGDSASSQTTQTQQTQQEAGSQDQRTSSKGGQAQPTDQSQQQTQQSLSDTDTDTTFGGRLRSDKDGNLVDANNRVVAKAGKERRLWEENARLKHYDIPELRNQLVDTERKLQNVEVLNNTPRQLGLNNDEAVQGLRLMASYRRDPVGTIQYILAEARANGVDLSKVGLPQHIDTAALGRMIDQRLQPIMQDREALQQEEEANRRADEQYRQFLARYPDASLHEDVIANMLVRDKELSLGEAYATLRLFATQNNLDWSQPLKPQLEARASGQQQQGANSQQQTQGGAPPMGGRSSNAQATPVNQAQPVASADADYADIIRESMREAGMNLS